MTFRRSSGLALAFGMAMSCWLAASEVAPREIVIRRAAEVPLDVELEIVLESAEDGGASRRIPASGLRTIAIPRSFAGRVGCSAEGYWCPWLELPRGDDEGEDEPAPVLGVFRSATVSGRVVLGREAPPEELLVEATVPLPGSPDVHFQVRTSVGERGEVAFEAPRGELDLRLAADGWAPIYRWGVVVHGDRASVGALRFERGSSVSGYVVHGSTGMPLADIGVFALPASAEDLSEDARHRLEALAERVVSDERGFFQLAGLPPGRYRLEVERDGFFPRGRPIIDVVENSETHLAEPVALLPASRLTVFVDPPSAPGEAGWKVTLFPQPGPDVHQAVTDEHGAAELRDLVPGTYRVEVGTAEHPTVWQEEVELSSDRILTVELPLVELVGTITLGGEPLVARLGIETGSGDHWRYRSDEDGGFAGVVRHPEFDLLFVHVEADEPEIDKTLEIRGLEAEDGVVELDLALEDRSIDGTVVDEVGHPVEGAEVRVEAGDRLVARRTTDDEGDFTARALDGGRYTVHAQARGRGSSEVVEADLSAVRHAGPFRLTLIPQVRIDGVLRSADGRPVQGARVEATAWQPTPYADVGHTDLAGRFWISVPKGARRLHLEIAAPSIGLIAVCASPPSPEGDLQIVLPAIADATVSLDLRASPDLPPAWIGPLVLLRRGGGFLSISTLRSWRQSNGGPWGDDDQIVPGLVPGEYALEWLEGPTWSKAAAACEPALRREPTWQSVGPGGNLHVRYDLEPHQRAAVDLPRSGER